MVTPYTLQCTPDGWEGSKEAHQPGMVRVALDRIIPLVGVEAKEKFDILHDVSVAIALEDQDILTQVAYVREHQMSPRKKSRNSTG